MKLLIGPKPKPAACGFIRELPNQGPALPGHCPFLTNPILPISDPSYLLPAGSQFTRGKTQMGVTRARPIWVTTILGAVKSLVATGRHEIAAGVVWACTRVRLKSLMRIGL